MNRWLGRLFAAASALFWLAVSPAQADLINPPSFAYTWDQSPTTLAADGTGTGSISLSVGSGTAVAPSAIVAANLSVITSTLAQGLDTFTNKAYKLTLALTDSASGAAGQLVFNGILNGTANTTSSNFTNHYVGSTLQSIHLGNYNYHVQILDPVLPPITGGTTQGGISAQVTFDVAGEPVQQVPEPSALLLASLGLPLAAAAGWWRLRALAAPFRTA